MRGDASMEAVDFRREGDAADVARWWAAVDNASAHYQRILASEAVGHFLREGRPGPPMFEAPKLRDAA